MANDAKVCIVGNLIKDPMQNNYNNSTVVSFLMAVKTTKKDAENKPVSDLYSVSVWGKFGEVLYPMMQKGTMVQVFGDLILQEYTDKKTGEKRESLAVRASDVKLLAKLKSAPKNNNDDDYSGPDPF